jgi:hypothetical protein
MTQPRLVVTACLALLLTGSIARLIAFPAVELPASLSDQEFWRLTEELSEPDGAFQYDNLLSNELVFTHVVPDLARVRPGRVYLGVGSEQNFTYIAAVRPHLGFITDIRRGNLHLHLMYKALFEISADRSEFVARLFSKKRQNALTARSTASDLMAVYSDAATVDEGTYVANLRDIENCLTKVRALPLSRLDLEGIARVYRAFYRYGPGMNYSATIALNQLEPGWMTYRDLMIQTDSGGQELSYLATEDSFTVVKGLEAANLIVPIVGNFSGPKALRAVAAYVKAHNATVGAFYVSNVEAYLQRAGALHAFCGNVAAMPLDEESVFIRPRGVSLPTAMMLQARQGAKPARQSSDRPAQIGQTSVRFEPGAGVVPIASEVSSCSGTIR